MSDVRPKNALVNDGPKSWWAAQFGHNQSLQRSCPPPTCGHMTPRVRRAVENFVASLVAQQAKAAAEYEALVVEDHEARDNRLDKILAAMTGLQKPLRELRQTLLNDGAPASGTWLPQVSGGGE
jgi:hypothetical protein